MELRSREEFGILNWAIILLSLMLAGIHLYLGNFAAGVPDERRGPFTIIGLVFLASPAVYLTSYWRPVLYLLGAGVVVYLGGLWVLAGMEFFLLGVITGLVGTAFGVLALYLYLQEEFHIATDNGS